MSGEERLRRATNERFARCCSRASCFWESARWAPTVSLHPRPACEPDRTASSWGRSRPASITDWDPSRTEVCAPPCQECTPLAPGLGRCAHGHPTTCPSSGVTAPANCIADGMIPETCSPIDEDCDGSSFDVEDAHLGYPCSTPTLPAWSGCATQNWSPSQTYSGYRPLAGHWVCDPDHGVVACMAIPGIDYCSAANCRTLCANNCVNDVHQTWGGSTVTEHGPADVATSTGIPAVWLEAPLYRSAEGISPRTALSWGENTNDQGCQGFCPGTPCESGYNTSCQGGLSCNVTSGAVGVCGSFTPCPFHPGTMTPTTPVTCWNHGALNSAEESACR